MDTAVLGEGEIQAIVIPPTSEENESKGQKRNQEEIQDAKKTKLEVMPIRLPPSDRPKAMG